MTHLRRSEKAPSSVRQRDTSCKFSSSDALGFSGLGKNKIVDSNKTLTLTATVTIWRPVGGTPKLLTKLKQRIQVWFTSGARLAHSVGLSPNHVSTIGILFAILSAFSYWNWQSHITLLIVAPILLLASGLCDALDGVVARIYGQTTVFGGFLDSLLDRYADAIVLSGVILGGLCDPAVGLIAVVGSLLVSYTRARAEAAGVKMEAVGMAERAERLIILAAASFLTIIWREALSWGVIVLAIITNVTVLQRVLYFRKTVQRKEKQS